MALVADCGFRRNLGTGKSLSFVGHLRTPMNKLLPFASLLLLSTTAHADWFYTLVKYDCDQQHDRVTISYVGAYNDEGKELVASKGENAWDPWSLIEVDDKGEEIVERKEIHKQCRLSDGVYNVTIGPSPGNSNVLGRCGAHISAWVKISRESKVVYLGGFDEKDCFALDATIVTAVSIRARGARALVKKANRNDFYK